MPRVPLIQAKTDLDPRHHAAWDAITESRGRIVGPYKVLLHSPELAQRMAHLGTHLRFESGLPGDVKELAILSVAREMDCVFEWAAHAPLARKAGVREEAIAAIRDRRPQGLTAEEAPVVQYVSQLLGKRRVDEPTFRAAEARFGVQGVVDLTALAGYYGMIACTLNAFEVTPDAGMEPLPV